MGQLAYVVTAALRARITCKQHCEFVHARQQLIYLITDGGISDFIPKMYYSCRVLFRKVMKRD